MVLHDSNNKNTANEGETAIVASIFKVVSNKLKKNTKAKFFKKQLKIALNLGD